MSEIGKKFSELKEKGEMAFMPFFTLGYPTIEKSKTFIKAIEEGGADLIELGVPFSDPLADGPTIQKTSHVALKAGMNLQKGLDIVRELRAEGLKVPVVLMGYFNPFLHFGVEKLAEEASKAGVNGFIIPDLPITEAEPWLKAFSKFNMDLIFFISPTTNEKRMEKIISKANGFLYCIAVKGVTGARTDLAAGINEFLSTIKSKTSIPLAVGFGISKAEHVSKLKGHADGAIVASALFNYLEQFPETEWEEKIRNFVRSFKSETLA